MRSVREPANPATERRGSQPTTRPDQRQATEPKSAPTAPEHPADPRDRLLFLELEDDEKGTTMDELKNVPTRVLEAELRKRREAEEAKTGEDLEVLAAEAFGREPRTGESKLAEASRMTDKSLDDIDTLHAEVFGKKE